MKRAHALGLLAAAPLAGCGISANSIGVGSKNFTESLLLGELYAQLLEAQGLHIQRRLNLGGTAIAMTALQKGQIDLYPEYTGTALLVILKADPPPDPAQAFAYVREQYQKRYDLVWLNPAPMNNTQALATTPAIAQRYGLHTLSDVARVAPQLRLGAVPEFLKRPDGLPGLQRVYGGYHFKKVSLLDFGLKYQALLSGNVDMVVAFGTDGAILADNLVVMRDDKGLFPAYHVAPVVRAEALQKRPEIATALNAVAPLLTDAVMRKLNNDIDGPEKREPADVAHDFMETNGLLPNPPACEGARGATIALHGIEVRYGDKLAVSEVELELKDGEFVVFLGPSGSGKSTLLRTINRLVEPSAGSIAIDGVDVRTLDPVQVRRGIGYVIQGVGLFPHLTVGENIAVVPSLLGWDAARIDARVTALLALMKLPPDYRRRYPRQLSGGEQQRVGVARALAAEPRALLMDEPFGALDTIVRASLQDEIRRVQRELGTTIVFVTHDIDEALRLADRIAVINDGRLIQVDTPERILAAPANDSVRSLVGIDAASRHYADARPLVERAPA